MKISAIKKRKAQSFLEYTMLVIVCLTAVGTMILYMQRAVSVRVRHLNQELNESQR